MTPRERAYAQLVTEMVFALPWAHDKPTRPTQPRRVGRDPKVGDLVHCATISIRAPFAFTVGIVQEIREHGSLLLREIGGGRATCLVSNEHFVVIERNCDRMTPYLTFSDRQLKLCGWVTKAIFRLGLERDIREDSPEIVGDCVRVYLRPHAFARHKGALCHPPYIDVPDRARTRRKDVEGFVASVYVANQAHGRFDWSPYFAETEVLP